MNILYAMLGGFALDWIFGDPAWLTHPVVIMGRAIAALESGLRKRLPKTPRGERLGGLTMAIVLPVGTLLLTGGVCRALAAVHPALGFAAELLWCAQALAATGLAQESTNVYRQLQKDDLPAARQAVGRIVGRDTEALTREGVIRAAVETVAENASDGVIAPLFYMMLGGAPLALTYKAVNTMDSMVGYKNERYLHFGRAAAKLDDAANYLPSRIAALLWVAAAALTGNDAKGAWRIWRRDRRNHASPNSAQTESACAGALGVQLAGPATYFGQYYDKPTIGDAADNVHMQDILYAEPREGDLSEEKALEIYYEAAKDVISDVETLRAAGKPYMACVVNGEGRRMWEINRNFMCDGIVGDVSAYIDAVTGEVVKIIYETGGMG